MPRLPEPCLTCGTLSTNGSRCELHAYQVERARNSQRAQTKRRTGQYSGAYKRLSKIVRATAVVCHLCGKPFEPGDQIEADHITPASPVTALEQLAPAHRSCNAKRGQKPA
jgi:5-methylcytosine-specific restriction endonuclease McrA